jgi:thiol-disulfide isomerase/thioredoxin
MIATNIPFERPRKGAVVFVLALVFAACAGPAGAPAGNAGRVKALDVPPPPATKPATEEAATQSDRERLEKLMAQPGSDAAVANALARFLPTTASKSERPAIYSLVAKAYVAALKAGAAADPLVEEGLCGRDAVRWVDTTSIVNAAYRLANEELRLRVADECVATVRSTLPIAPGAPTIDPVSFARLQGTLSFLRGDTGAAVAPLKLAATNIELLDDPLLHLRLTQALTAVGADNPAFLTEACGRAKLLYKDQPLLPGAKASLTACVAPGKTPDRLIAEIDSIRRARLLASRRETGEAVKPLGLENNAREPADLDLKDPTRVTVVAFFSTWCPHCNKELPRVNQFATAVAEDAALKDRVRVVGVRTSVEREAEPYEEFLARHQPVFPIYTDPTLSLAFGSFCKSQGLKPALPTIAVVDTTGIVRFLLVAGDYQDTAQDLGWAVHSLLDQPGSDKP